MQIKDLKEKVYSHVEHSKEYTGLNDNGVMFQRFIYDAADRLVFIKSDIGNPVANILNQDSVLLKFREDATMPQPWHCSRKEFELSLKEFINYAPDDLKARYLELYPGYKPFKVNKLYSRTCEKPLETEKILSIIDAIEDQDANEDLKYSAVEKLYEHCVSMVPQNMRYNAKYHESDSTIKENTLVVTLTNGWINNGQVIRKARVAVNNIT